MFDLLFVQLQLLGLTLLACRRIAPAVLLEPNVRPESYLFPP